MPGFACGGIDMRGDYIDFISSYCDGWCERCAFTMRCSAYSVKVAAGMCDGDLEAAIELAVGAPPPCDEAERRQREEFLDLVNKFEPTEHELEEAKREDEARDERVDESPLMTDSLAVSMLVHRWIEEHPNLTSRSTDAVLANAIETAGRDGFFIHVKLHRALDGRDRAKRGDEWDEHPVQNDWNGSAKVALISIVRGIDAWNTIAQFTGDPDAAHIAKELQTLRLGLFCPISDVLRSGVSCSKFEEIPDAQGNPERAGEGTEVASVTLGEGEEHGQHPEHHEERGRCAGTTRIYKPCNRENHDPEQS